MRQIQNFLFSFAIVRALFTNSYFFIKADNQFYIFKSKNYNWPYTKTFLKIKKAKMNIQEVYLPSGKQQLVHVRCIKKDCQSIINMQDDSYVVTYCGTLDVNKYVCNHCGTEQHFISDEINEETYYLNCHRESIGDIYIKNNSFPEREALVLKHVS